jgi:hypothetical protein
MYAPFARSDYYETSASPGGHQSATDLPAAGPAARREGRPQVVPTFTTEPIKELGARLYPGSLAMPTPQAFGMASPPDLKTGFGVDRTRRPAGAVTRCEPGPYPSGLSRVGHLRGVRQRFLSYTFSSLLAGPRPSDSADPFRTLSGLLSADACVPTRRLPSASPGSCDRLAVESFHPHSIPWRLVAHFRLSHFCARLCYVASGGWRPLSPVVSGWVLPLPAT